jgi:protein-disulfide isomerase
MVKYGLTEGEEGMAKRYHKKEQPAAKPLNRMWIYLGIVVVVAIAVVAALVLLNPPKADTATTTAPAFTAVPNPDGLTMGKADAPVLVEEYSDFQCPYCKQFFTDLQPGIITKYVTTGKVKFTYTPFSFIGNESKIAAEAAFCAVDQNKFWEMEHQIFHAQGAENSGIFTDTSLTRMATAAGLDMAKFKSCYSAHTYKQKVEDTSSAAATRGVSSTPSFYVNGKGPFASNQVTAEIDKALAGN